MGLGGGEVSVRSEASDSIRITFEMRGGQERQPLEVSRDERVNPQC